MRENNFTPSNTAFSLRFQKSELLFDISRFFSIDSTGEVC